MITSTANSTTTDSSSDLLGMRLPLMVSVVAFSILLPLMATATPEAPPPSPETAPGATATALTRAPMMMTFLTGAGVNGQIVTTGVAAATSQLASVGATIPSLEASFCTAASATANDSIAIGGFTAARQNIRDEAQTAVATAATARLTAIATIRDLLTPILAANAGPEALPLIQRMDANAHRLVPEAFKCLDLSEDAWQVLNTALRKTEQGLGLAPHESAALAAANSDPLVQTVAQRIATNGPTIEALFAQYAHTAAASASGPAQ